MSDVPFIAVGNDELGDPLPAQVECPHCKELHEVKDSNPPMLQYVKCPVNGSSYLVGIRGSQLRSKP